jgi:hypothetical protein
MRLSEGVRIHVPADPNHQGVAGDAATHASVHHETHTTHHLLFDHVRPPGKDPTNTGGNLLQFYHHLMTRVVADLNGLSAIGPGV